MKKNLLILVISIIKMQFMLIISSVGVFACRVVYYRA